MITLNIDLTDIRRNLVAGDHQIEMGGGVFEPFKTKHLVTSILSTPAVREVWVGEDDDPFSDTESPDGRASSTRSFEEFEGIRIQMSDDSAPKVEIVRTAAGTTPIYVSHSGSTLFASWRFEVAARAAGPARPDIEACRIFLEHGKSQTRAQILQGVFMLWPGERATFDEKGLRFSVISDPEIVLSSALADGARATDEFVRLIGTAMSRNLLRSSAPLIEVSGGMDSTCVAIAAAAIRSPLTSYGVIQPGAIGVQQRQRRRELVNLLGLNDYEGISWDPLPTLSLDFEECRVTPYDDLYRMACLNTIKRNGLLDSDIVITGIGGDELTKEHTYHREEWEVGGFASSSSLVAAVSRADMFMRHGIWPVNPLLDMSVINFCRALPRQMREGRLLNILTMTRSGLSDGFVSPRYVENFGPVLMMEAIELDYDAQFETSIIGDYGIADVYAALAEVRDATKDGVTKRMVGKMYNMLKLERTLRSYVT